ncbi:uncharacterized protein B0H64DRAFT_204550 [Chaetomium fimeti]|uniref:Uncharacterized protein n=1 Tax=Chaetomium fimeti TaxID=1854472 RepID=A0AAE0HCD3_9PEZI|nr:hypothetical protein B0H64DRAFT_204550 [Chaetomium fimeti]
MHAPESTREERYRSRDDNKSPARAHHLAALYLLPILTTALALWALLHTWHLQLSPNLSHHHSHQRNNHHPNPPKPLPTHPHRWTTCGTSPSEARARGCRFDILSFAWQTPECYDSDLMAAFLAHHAWQFYAHANRTDETVDLAVALRGERTLYVDWEYHVAHCTFMWRQMHRAYAVRGFVDAHLDGYGHTLHCQGVLLERGMPGGVVNVVAAVKYPECREVGGRGRGTESFYAQGAVHEG